LPSQEEQNGRFLHRPQQDYPAATVAEFCTAVLILDWFREGRDIEAEMYKLSTYLGHSEPKHTFWYIEAVPELMQLAAARAERQVLEGAS